MKPQTLYQVMGMTFDTFDEQKLKTVKKNILYYLHPDKKFVTENNSTHFKRELVLLAYRILIDETLREKYNYLMQKNYRENCIDVVTENKEDISLLCQFEKKIENVVVIKASKPQQHHHHTHGTHVINVYFKQYRPSVKDAAEYILKMNKMHYAF